MEIKIYAPHQNLGCFGFLIRTERFVFYVDGFIRPHLGLYFRASTRYGKQIVGWRSLRDIPVFRPFFKFRSWLNVRRARRVLASIK